MDKKKGLLNVFVAIGFKLLLMVGSLIVRRYLIQYIGNEVNGIYSLYVSIIGFLSVAELGVGSAITFCMYKPIVEKDSAKVSALFRLFRKLYFIIGGIILAGGLIVMPFLPKLAKGYESVNINLYTTFAVMLCSILISYLFSAKTSLINAYKNDYITTAVSSVGQLIQYGLQIAVIITMRSFLLYLVCCIISALLQWFATEIIFARKYREKVTLKEPLDQDTRKDVVRNVKAMFMHKIGTVLVNTVDSVIISAFIGVVLLGKFSNYTTIGAAMEGILFLFFTPLTSVIGHLCVEEDKIRIKQYYNFFYGFNYALGVIFFLGYYAVIDSVITICFGNNLELDSSISFVITLNYFLQFTRKATLLFRDATGTFYHDRWKPVIEGVSNVILSLVFVKPFGITGVILATIITNLVLCHIVEPYILYKYAFSASVKGHCARNFSNILLFVGALVIISCLKLSFDNQWVELLVNGSISVAVSVVLCLILIIANKDFRIYSKYGLKMVLKKIKK